MIPDIVHGYARDRRLSLQDAAQTFLQVVALRHLSVPEARFMGGTALVLGYGNPRFSEDVDLAQVENPEHLKPGLVRAKAELEGWFGSKVELRAPKPGLRTWRLTVLLGRAESLSLHVDSQPYHGYTQHPVVVEYPSLSPFVVPTLEVDEIMAEKILALAYRRYLGGRDLFDLWFHWLRRDDEESRRGAIQTLVNKKLEERRLDPNELGRRLTARLSTRTSLERARAEWNRYLPSEFQTPAVIQDILEGCRKLSGISL